MLIAEELPAANVNANPDTTTCKVDPTVVTGMIVTIVICDPATIKLEVGPIGEPFNSI
ncbi:hypothetical protein pah_c253o056 [Parachlamydia acanthamoebae str. Hall's coccus]|nr:hypothetical protein pah_c253o056 [Parachlamydia acanthamoebae str. Hall's coccus]